MIFLAILSILTLNLLILKHILVWRQSSELRHRQRRTGHH